jgi:protein TonB
MTERLIVANIAAWVAQACALAAATAALAWLFRLRDPRASLAVWHTALLAIVLLPAIQPWQRPEPLAAGSVTVTEGAAPVIAAGSPRFDPRPLIPPILAAGVFARLAWLALGALQLRRERRRSRPLGLPAPLERLRREMEVVCDVRLSARLAGPATFGVRDPVVLLPEKFSSLPESTQSAMLCHELEHVRRGDWLFTLAEEIVRALLWFHPAVWWLLGRVHLAREQAVDRAVVRRACSRQEYLETLLAVAGERMRAAMLPAPSFLKKRHLAQRVAALIRETPMSKTRVFASLASILGLAALAARLAVLQFPMTAPAQTIKMGGERLLHHGPLYYPPEAAASKAEGTVIVEATINARGEVVDARVLSGPEPLRRAALKTVLDFHYSKEVIGPATFQVALEYKLPSERVPSAAPPPPPPPPPPPADTRIRAVRFIGNVPAEMQREILSKLPVRDGSVMTGETHRQIVAALNEVDEHLAARWAATRTPTGNEVTLLIGLRENMAPPPPPAPVGGVVGGIVEGVPGGVVGGVPSEGDVTRMRVGGNVQSSKLEHKVTPVYPTAAKEQGIQGLVRFNVVIAADGAIRNMQLISGHPLLVQAAFDAVRQWRYAPTYLNGLPVEVSTMVDVNFTLLP